MFDQTFQPKATTNSPTKLIFIVEDDEEIGNLLLQIIEQETIHKVIHHVNARNALDALTRIVPHLLLLDYSLPDMNGLEIYNHLREMKGFENIPAILMSANMPKNVAQQRDILSLKKPFELSELLENVSTLLTERCDA